MNGNSLISVNLSDVECCCLGAAAALFHRRLLNTLIAQDQSGVDGFQAMEPGEDAACRAAVRSARRSCRYPGVQQMIRQAVNTDSEPRVRNRAVSIPFGFGAVGAFSASARGKSVGIASLAGRPGGGACTKQSAAAVARYPFESFLTVSLNGLKPCSLFSSVWQMRLQGRSDRQDLQDVSSVQSMSSCLSSVASIICCFDHLLLLQW